MARRRFQQLPPERQDEILTLAAAEFARSGFSGTSYNQLLARIGLGKGSAYYYFEDKRDLFLAVVERCYASFFEHVSALEPPRSIRGYWRHVERASLLGFEFMEKDPTAAGIMRCLQNEAGLLAELTAESVLASMTDSYRELLLLGQRLGAVRRDLPLDLMIELARGLSLNFDRWFVLRQAGGCDSDLETISRWYTDAARRLFAPAASRRAAPASFKARARARAAR